MDKARLTRRAFPLLGLLFLLYCAVPRAAQVRATASVRLDQCLGTDVGYPVSGSRKLDCLKESEAYCKSSGLEPSCGIDELWGRR